MTILKKHYGSFEMDDFIQSVRDDYDNKLITYDGQDYMFDLVYSRKTKEPAWYLTDALEFMTVKHPKHLAGPFGTIDELLNAPVLDGKSIIDRYDELLTADFVSVIALRDSV